MLQAHWPQIGKLLIRPGLLDGQIGENGVCDKRKYILWEAVDILRLSVAEHASAHGLVYRTEATLQVADRAGQKVKLQGIYYRNIVNKVKQESSGVESFYSGVYNFVVSKVFERHWLDFARRLGQGERIALGKVSVDSNGLYASGILGGTRATHVSRIMGYEFKGGNLHVLWAKDDGSIGSSYVEPISDILNLHLLTAYISIAAKRNKVQTGGQSPVMG